MTEIPEEMTAIEIAESGGPEVLRPVQRAVPKPQQGEVLIKVAAAGVNRPDVMQRKGMYPPPPGASDIPGLEIAGEVVALGPGVQGVVKGDSVCALVAGGGYAEYCTAPAVQCLPVPAPLSMAEAAGIPETFFTVWANVFDIGNLREGQTILIHGGSSGIGTTAIQLAAARGARVLATAGSKEKCDFCEELGAELAIDYKTEDFVERVHHATDGRGVDLILDMVGGDYLMRNLTALADKGTLVVIAVMSGPKAEINLVEILRRQLTVTGSPLRPRPVAEKGRLAEALRREIWPLLESGRVKPILHRTFPLAEAAEAHALMESSKHIGKIVLET